MMIKQKLFLVFVPFLLAASLGAKEITSSGKIMQLSVGPRNIGMGESGVAMNNGVWGMFWNPATIANAVSDEIGLTYSSWLDGMSYQNGAYVRPLMTGGKPVAKDISQDILEQEVPGQVVMDPGSSWQKLSRVGALGIGFTFFSTAMQGYDKDNKSTGDIAARDIGLSVTYARKFLLDVGISAKLLNEQLENESAAGLSLDFGVIYPLAVGVFRKNPLNIGIAVQNIGGGLKFVSEVSPFTTVIRAGVSTGFDILGDNMQVNLDLVKPDDNDLSMSLGAEYALQDILALRVGYKTDVDLGNGLRAGIGINMKVFKLDYAYTGIGVFGNSHRVSVTFRFGPFAGHDKSGYAYKKGMAYYEAGNFERALLEFNKALDYNPLNEEAFKMMKKLKFEKAKVK